MAFVQIRIEKFVEKNLLTLDFFDNLEVNNRVKAFHQKGLFFVFLSFFFLFFFSFVQTYKTVSLHKQECLRAFGTNHAIKDLKFLLPDDDMRVDHSDVTVSARK